MSHNIIKITIGKEEIEIDNDEELKIGDVSGDMDEVASQIGYYGELLGAATREKTELDGMYRKWRGAIAIGKIKKDPKIAEWKVKAETESQDRFEKFKRAQASCEYNVTTLDKFVKALIEKSQNLRSKGARMRAEFESEGMTTPTQTASERKSALRERKGSKTK